MEPGRAKIDWIAQLAACKDSPAKPLPCFQHNHCLARSFKASGTCKARQTCADNQDIDGDLLASALAEAA
jgi:hypothetical protein